MSINRAVNYIHNRFVETEISLNPYKIYDLRENEYKNGNYTVSDLERICIYNIYTYVIFIYIMYI